MKQSLNFSSINLNVTVILFLKWNKYYGSGLDYETLSNIIKILSNIIKKNLRNFISQTRKYIKKKFIKIFKFFHANESKI